MNCREFVEFLMAYLDEELPRNTRETFEGHMGDCPGCVTYLETYKETVELTGALCRDPEGPVPENAPEALIQAILAARKE